MTMEDEFWGFDGVGQNTNATSTKQQQKDINGAVPKGNPDSEHILVITKKESQSSNAPTFNGWEGQIDERLFGFDSPSELSPVGVRKLGKFQNELRATSSKEFTDEKVLTHKWQKDMNLAIKMMQSSTIQGSFEAKESVKDDWQTKVGNSGHS